MKDPQHLIIQAILVATYRSTILCTRHQEEPSSVDLSCFKSQSGELVVKLGRELAFDRFLEIFPSLRGFVNQAKASFRQFLGSKLDPFLLLLFKKA
jgi:hypothetical protein